MQTTIPQLEQELVELEAVPGHDQIQAVKLKSEIIRLKFIQANATRVPITKLPKDAHPDFFTDDSYDFHFVKDAYKVVNHTPCK